MPIVEPNANGHHVIPSPDVLKARKANGASTNGHWSTPLTGLSVNGTNGAPPAAEPHSTKRGSLLRAFLDGFQELERFRNGDAVTVDGRTLSIAGVVAVARYGASAALSEDRAVRDAVDASRRVISTKVDERTSVYGVSTGFGGSADTRTDQPLLLGAALLQHQHMGVLPRPGAAGVPTALPLLDPLGSTAMPEAWVRAAVLIRMNSLVRGHSGVRWQLVETMGELLSKDITPLVPLRGSISASGDLSPLSYIAATLVGNPAIRAWHTPRVGGPRELAPSIDALRAHGVAPLTLQSKEHLGILNGTAFSAGVAALTLHDAAALALLGGVCTAVGTEALHGTRASFDPFIHVDARPHPGQIEAAGIMYGLLDGSMLAETEEEELSIAEDKGTLRQDRYPLRTAPQFLGPQLEDILSALDTVTQECNSTTDNPLIDGKTGRVHHGGNFQAMAVTSAMEKARLALHHTGKLLFAQCTELLNPAMSRGLPPSLAATDPALDYHAKGIDIAVASYVSELGFLANPVSTHIQSAEMHNQAVNSLALISARKTIDAVQVLSLLVASYLYVLCQALDLRAMQRDFAAEVTAIVNDELADAFGASLSSSDLTALCRPVLRAVHDSLEHTGTMDAVPRLDEAAACGVRAAVESLSALASAGANVPLAVLTAFRMKAGARAATALQALRAAYLEGARGPAPAAHLLKRTRPVYEFVRVELGVTMNGRENLHMFAEGLGVEEVSIGEKISTIYEAIRDGRMHSVVAGLFA